MLAMFTIRMRMWWFRVKYRLDTTMLIHRRRVVSFCLALVAVAAVAMGYKVWAAWPRPPVCSGVLRAQPCELMERGDYDAALASIEAHLQKEPGQKTWPGLKDLMLREMTVSFRIQYLAGGKMPARRVERGKLTLSPSDKYSFVVRPSEKCYLYLFQIGSTGELQRVFPNKTYSPAKNPVPAGEQFIPASPKRLQVNPVAGEEYVVMVAARWARPELESLAQKAAKERDAGRRQQVIQQFMERIKNEREHTEQLGGLVFGESRFRNSGEQK